jgi:hypothetical protein
MMSEQPYAVYEQETLLSVFSNEGLAQTHAAKLRAILPEGEEDEYTVAPLVMDADADLEVVHIASISMSAALLPNYRPQDIELDREEELARTLQPSLLDTYRPHLNGRQEEYLEVSADAYGWSPEQAIVKLHKLIERYLADPKRLIEVTDD